MAQGVAVKEAVEIGCFGYSASFSRSFFRALLDLLVVYVCLYVTGVPLLMRCPDVLCGSRSGSVFTCQLHFLLSRRCLSCFSD